MTMLEKIARAIYQKRNGAEAPPWHRLSMAHKNPYRDDAHAALNAMLDPTDSMKAAGKTAFGVQYTDMIVAAIEEGKDK